MAEPPRPDRPQPEPSEQPGPPDAGANRPDAGRADADRAEATERAFLNIVAHMSDDPGEATWPAAEDLRLPPHPPVVVVRPARPPRPSGDPDAPTETDLQTLGASDGDSNTLNAPDADDEHHGQPGPRGASFVPSDDHYVPPPPPRAPRLRPATRAALVSMALGVALLVAPTLAGTDPSLTFETVAVMLVLGGVSTLVARMREHPDDPDDGPDDGAVV